MALDTKHDLGRLRVLADGRTGRVAGTLGGVPFQARIAIQNHMDKVRQHYAAELRDCALPLQYPQFGVVIDFEQPIELEVHDAGRVLDDGLREVLAQFGPVMLRNAVMPERERAGGQRNIFPSLRFHFDRGATQADRYSLFWRDPFDPVHRDPRTSSTLIVANAVAQLQAFKEGDTSRELKPLYQLYENEDVRPLVGNVVIEQAWSAPPSTGEITILDNRTVLHASYYRRAKDKGYPIGVRYLY